MSTKQHLNKVYLGNVFDLFKKLDTNSVDVVYGDPDYNVGIKYDGISYTRNFQEYIDWYIELAKESRRVLKKDGNLFFINYPKQNAYLRVKYLDKACYDVRDYAWVFNCNIGHSPRRFTTAHRSILHARKSKNNKFYKEAVAVPYKNPTDKRIRKLIESGSPGRMPYDWFEFNLVKNVSTQKTIHSCQIPQDLVKMLFKSCTKKGNIVLLLFGGSGSELAVCKELGLNFLSAETNKKYCNLINERLKTGTISKKYRMLYHMKNRTQ